MCRNAHDSEDVLQDALLNVALHLPEFEGRSSLSSWAFALTRSACVRKRRGLKNQPMAGEERTLTAADPGPSPEAQTADQELAATLSRALDTLPEDYREVLALRDMEGLSAPETAAALGVSVDAVKSRLHRARAALREALKPALEPASPAPSESCPNVVELWSTKLEGDLGVQDCAAMEKHMLTCKSCSAACDALKGALVLCRTEATGPVPEEVQAQVKAAIRALDRAQHP